jgi:hypothetical protein
LREGCDGPAPDARADRFTPGGVECATNVLRRVPIQPVRGTSGLMSEPTVGSRSRNSWNRAVLSARGTFPGSGCSHGPPANIAAADSAPATGAARALHLSGWVQPEPPRLSPGTGCRGRRPLDDFATGVYPHATGDHGCGHIRGCHSFSSPAEPPARPCGSSHRPLPLSHTVRVSPSSFQASAAVQAGCAHPSGAHAPARAAHRCDPVGPRQARPDRRGGQ